MKQYILFLSLLASLIVKGQQQPVIGKKIPEFKLTSVDYYDQNYISIDNLEGKWTILDFWSTTCSACIRSFPKLNELQSQFKGKVQFILIGNSDSWNKNIRNVYEKFRNKFKLELTVAYDSILFKQFGIVTVPYIIVIDPSLNVYDIPKPEFLRKENIQRLIDNKGPDASRETLESGKLWEYWIQDTAQIRNIVQRSILSRYKGELLTVNYGIKNDNAARRFFQTVHLSVSQLYLAAYDWHYNSSRPKWKVPILEIKDTSVFLYDTYTYRGLYNYNVVVPKTKNGSEDLQKTMQNDLKQYFGYDVRIERRLMPYWSLKATKHAEKTLVSKSSEYYFNGTAIGVDGKGIHIENILATIRDYNHKERLTFVDETGITGRIDISLMADMTDIKDIQNSLTKHGLKLEIAHQEMDVLIICDPKLNTNEY